MQYGVSRSRKEKFRNMLRNRQKAVRILQVERAIVDVTGVEDVTGTTLNGVSKNYTVGKNKLPVKGELTCTSK